MIHVGLLANIDHRVDVIMQREHFDREEAQSHVEEVDRARVAFVRKFFKVHPDEPTLYHMVLNMDKMEAKTAAAVIVHACADLES